MAWFKVDDHLHSHRKAIKAGTEAMGLWVLAGSWSAAEESDGWVPAYVLPRLVGPTGEELADQLVAAGLWETAEQDGEAGYLFRGWDDYQPTKEQLEAKRAEARERMRRARDVRANGKRSSDDVRSTRPDPTRPLTTSSSPAGDGAAFDAFWSAYPRKVGKAAARKAYDRARRTTDPATILAAVEAAKATEQWRRDNGQYVPHPTTWLNQGRWDDEAPTPLEQAAPAAPRRTLAQCPDGSEHPAHDWSDARNAFRCQGV